MSAAVQRLVPSVCVHLAERDTNNRRPSGARIRPRQSGCKIQIAPHCPALFLSLSFGWLGAPFNGWCSALILRSRPSSTGQLARQIKALLLPELERLSTRYVEPEIERESSQLSGSSDQYSGANFYRLFPHMF